jgi:hypothetical protein
MITATMENSMVIIQKINVKLTYDLSVLLLNVYLKEVEAGT